MEKYYFEAFEGLTRLGPGSKESTLKAISMLGREEDIIQILDIGCGVGAHTILLAHAFPNATIIAIDNHMPYIEKLNETINECGLSHRVLGRFISMFEMPFDDNSFDLIWAEGSIYIAGFRNGLKDWKKLLKSDGCLVCSELSWITDLPSEDIYTFWNEEYPQIDTIENKIAQIKSEGYNYKSHFIMPVTDWTDNYYSPLQSNLNNMLEKYKDNEIAKEVIGMLQAEINLYHKYSSEYSYVFYMMFK